MTKISLKKSEDLTMIPSIYALLEVYPSATAIAESNIRELTNLLFYHSKGKYGEETARLIQDSAKMSIGSYMPVKSMELKHTIRLIKEFDFEIKEIEKEVKYIMDALSSPILSTLFNATKYVCNWDPIFSEYLSKKREEGKAYNVAISHAAKKMVRVIYHLEKTGETYKSPK